jgi:hydrogenase expression/formation protein
MVDLEFYARRALREGKKNAIELVAAQYAVSKGFSRNKSRRYAQAVVDEVIASRIRPKNPYASLALETKLSGVKAGEFGLGSRGEGDRFTHEKIAKIFHRSNLSSAVKVVLEPANHDDVGAVKLNGSLIVGAVDGAHSRLSDFPFLMGFHDARAALRDVVAKGAEPLFLMDDVHLSDDGDISKLLEFVAGVSAVSELTRVPVVSGSTLRVGGDMVLGDRIVGSVSAVGYLKRTRVGKSSVRAGDLILLTEGSGGGTVSTAAIYSGRPDLVAETLNVDFVISMNALRATDLAKRVHWLTDVTNGGIRGDLELVARQAKVRIVVREEEIRDAVNPKVLKLLDELKMDPLGLSIDSLMLFVPPADSHSVVDVLSKAGIRSVVAGYVEKGKGCYLSQNGRLTPLRPKFRETAYTPLKKLVGEEPPPRLKELQEAIESASEIIEEKRKRIVAEISGRRAVLSLLRKP